MEMNHSNHAFESRREIRDKNQLQFLQLHKSNPRLDNPLLTLQDKQKIAEAKAAREQAAKQTKQDQLFQDQRRRKERSVEDLRAWFRDQAIAKDSDKQVAAASFEKEKRAIARQQRELETILARQKKRRQVEMECYRTDLTRQVEQRNLSQFINDTRLNSREHSLNKSELELAQKMLLSVPIDTVVL